MGKTSKQKCYLFVCLRVKLFLYQVKGGVKVGSCSCISLDLSWVIVDVMSYVYCFFVCLDVFTRFCLSKQPHTLYINPASLTVLNVIFALLHIVTCNCSFLSRKYGKNVYLN